MMIRPTAVEPRTGYRIWIRYSDGAEGEVDLVELCQDLPSMGKKYGCEISEEAVGLMMGGNAGRVLGVG